MLPLFLKGYNPIIVSVPICVGVIVITLLLVSGVNKKSFAAIIGTAGSYYSWCNCYFDGLHYKHDGTRK